MPAVSYSPGRRVMTDPAIEIGRQAQLARRANRPEDAHRLMLQAVELLRQDGAPRDLVQALRALAEIEKHLDRDDAARSSHEQAVAICRAKLDPLTLAHTVRHLGDFHRRGGRAGLAEPCYLEAIGIYRGHAATPACELANAIRPLAILRDEAGREEEAKQLWREARDLYASVDVQEGVAECSDRIARLEA